LSTLHSHSYILSAYEMMARSGLLFMWL
jgi:hypothetical protein